MENIYQIKITLEDSDPSIWRRFLVKSDILLPELHKILQTVMGWNNTHIHQFVCKNKYYSLPDGDEWGYSDVVNYSKIKLNSLVTKENEAIFYEYDLGDGWMHKLVLEKIVSANKDEYHPQCIDGEGCCPPEDCGGLVGYYNMLDIIHDSSDRDHKEMMDWIGCDFDPERFRLEEVNKLLKEEDYGCISLG